LGINPHGTIYAQTSYFGPAGLVGSTDGGKTWNGVTATGLTSAIGVLAFDPQGPDHLFAGTLGGGIFELNLVSSETH
jgi:hypothetical protein